MAAAPSTAEHDSFSAVDRIEIVADGASAIYGSDAVAGVVNIILKRNYDGFKLSGRFGDRDRDSGEEESLSMLFGASSDRGSVTFGIEYDRRDPIFDADREFTKAKYGDYDGDGDIVGYAETAGVSFYGYSAINPNWSPDVPYDPNDKNTWYVTPGANCQDDPGGTGFVGVMRADLVFGPEAGFYCGYAYALVSANRASLERLNSWVSAEYEINDSLDVYMDAIISDNESFGRYAPPEAPSATISMRSTAEKGIMFRLTVPPPPKEGEPATRRPLIITRVRPAPTPRRSIVALDCALLPDDSRKEPSEFRFELRSASATEMSP